MLYLLFNRLGYEIKWLTQSETEIAVISSLLGIAVIFCLWSSITSSLAKLRWRDILYIPSLLVIQLVIHFAIIAICLLTVKGFSLSDPAVSGNQQSLDAMGNEYRNQIVSVIAIFIWSALVGPFVENVFFMYFIQGRLLESITVRNNFALPTDNAAKMIAQQMITAIEPKRFSKLSFLEIEDQERFFIDRNGNRQMIPILWVKYSDTTDGFSWVGIAGNGEVVEYERQAFYDYVNGGGKTEQWINDDWLLQHKSLFFKSELTGSQKCEETNDD